jgi:asparagine synthase (glutamine-hydrolysing)
MPDRLNIYNLLNRLDDGSLFGPQFRASVDSQRPITQQRATWNSLGASSLVNRMLGYDWKFTLADNDLPKVRVATELAGVSVGFPLLARDLTDFSLSIPPS